MLKPEQVQERLAAMRDEQWLDRSHTLLSPLKGEARELVACAIHPERHERLIRNSPAELPEAIRSKTLLDYEIEAAGAKAIAATSDGQRFALLKRLVPGRERALEAAWKAMERRPVGDEFESRPFRSAQHPELNQSRALWLCKAIQSLGPLKGTLPELAGWISHLEEYGGVWPWILVGAIEAGGPEGEETLRTVIACARGEHEISGVDGAVIQTLLLSSRPEGWECVEKLLLAAQRQEGLRQSILETVHMAHPGAFRRLCRVILDHDLCRFSSVVRAADVWFGLLWDSASAKVVEEAIEMALRFLDAPGERARAIEKGKPVEAYFAMWAAAFEDIDDVLPLAERALASKDPVTRYAGAHMAVQVGGESVIPILVRALGDADLRVAARALQRFHRGWFDETKAGPAEKRPCAAVFDALERLLGRIKGRAVKVEAALWPWTKGELKAETVASAMAGSITSDTAHRLIVHTDRLSAFDRAELARSLGGPDGINPWEDTWPQSGATARAITEAARRALVGLAGDASARVVNSALRALWNRPIADDELDALIALLKRKSAEVRTGALRRAGQLPDDRLLALAARLADSRAAEQRAAGLEIWRTMAESGRSAGAAREAAVRWGGGRAISKSEQVAFDSICESGVQRPRRDDAFGLLNPANLTQPPPASPRPMLRMTAAAWEVLAGLARIVLQNKAMELKPEQSLAGGDPILLGGNYCWRIPSPRPGDSREIDEQRCQVAGLLFPWLSDRPAASRDPDGLELLRALLALTRYRKSTRTWEMNINWPKEQLAAARRDRLDVSGVLQSSLEFLLRWAMKLDGDRGYAAALLDSAEGTVAAGLLAGSGDDDLDDGPAAATPNEALCGSGRDWIAKLRDLDMHGLIADGSGEPARVWRLALAARPEAARRWAAMSEKEREPFYQGTAASLSISIDPDQVLAALRAGAATEDDVLDYATHSYWNDERGHIDWLTQSPELQENDDEDDAPPWRRRLDALMREARQHPAFRSAADRLRSRIIELELARGDTPTEASPMVRNIQHAGGAEVCVRCLAALGARALKRGPGWNDESRQGTLTHLVAATLPAPGDTPDCFAILARGAGITDDVLITLAVFTPQWVRHVEHTLGRDWAGFEEAVWWIHAHTKDSEYRVNSALRKKWQAAIAERTPLQPDELRDGAVDVAWFSRIQETLGPKRWSRVYEAAKFACGGAGHKRAQLFADAMTGAVKERELLSRVKSKRHQDSIRALGLAPLKKGKDGQAQILLRYKLMQEIRRTSRKHGGSLLQASEKRAVEIGMENLARTAGYADPLRLQWAMERLEVADLAKGPVKVKVGDITVALCVTDEGAPQLATERKSKPLASIPPAAKKDKRIAELSQRATDLRRAGSRMRQSLEQAMCRGDEFTGAELTELFGHPVLRPMLQRLVFVTDAGGGLAGYPDKNGRALRDHAGALEPLKSSDRLRLAHPHDLLKRRDWHKWQRDCFEAERIQPFKQVFREVYVPTRVESGRATESTRYEGHQVNPRQALALLGSRQWVARAEEGVQRTFYKERLTAGLEFAETFYSPAEVEGLTLRALRFTRAGRWEPLTLADIPPRVFSEAMRDLDLVVSVAHRGGVDPEASQSTVEMRAALVGETCRLLRLGNVKIDGARALITGARAEYAVHLGSAGVHLLPGGAVWIVPVHAQHRGRIFLPFADDDPKTAEVVSKVILLARDSEIQDPGILEQIARA